MALHGVLKRGFLALDRDIIYADITLRASAHGSNAAMLAILGG